MEQEPILHVWINHDHDLVDLTITTTTKGQHGKVTKTSEVIHTNQKHPFFTLEHGFLPVGQITLGMHLLRADGTYGVVTGWKVVPGTKVMYNLEVAQDHTFTVGARQWVVHNHCGPGRNGEGFADQRLLKKHFGKHHSEFSPPFANPDAYEQGALDFMTQPSSASPTLHEGTSLRFDGTTDTVRVDTATGHYGVMGHDGTIRSFYIPDPATNGGVTPEDWFLSRISDLTF